jgi:hypothetical protein
MTARALAAEERFEDVGEVVDQVPAVGDLNRIRRAVACAVVVGSSTSGAWRRSRAPAALDTSTLYEGVVDTFV